MSSEEQAQAPRRRPYETPRLVDYGSLTLLTLGQSGKKKGDGADNMMN